MINCWLESNFSKCYGNFHSVSQKFQYLLLSLRTIARTIAAIFSVFPTEPLQ